MVTIKSLILAAFVIYAFNPFQSKVGAEQASGSGFMIPLSKAQDWQVLKYNNIEANDIRFSEDGLVVNVKQSANPIIFPFDMEKTVTAVIATGELLDGELNIPAGETQGSPAADDYVFKLGLVEKGDKSLNWIQRAFAAQWVNTLYELAPENSGISKIRFLNVVQRKEDVGERPFDSSSDLMLEENVTFLDSRNGSFQIKKTFDPALEILALWLNVDGDNTKSTYSVLIKSIELR